VESVVVHLRNPSSFFSSSGVVNTDRAQVDKRLSPLLSLDADGPNAHRIFFVPLAPHKIHI
jgi:hypothetical protein